MISAALKFSSDSLNQFLRNRMGLDEDKVLLNNLIESNGSIPERNHNKVVISLVNVDKETVRPYNIRNVQLKDGSYTDINPSEKYNLYVLISSNFSDYNETLKFLDAVLLFFQKNPCLDGRTHSNVPEGVSKLEYEVEKISHNEMHNLWTAMGAKYQPSMLYKVRLITVQSAETIATRSAVTQQENNVIQ